MFQFYYRPIGILVQSLVESYLKNALDAFLLSIIKYRNKGKWSNPRKGESLFSTLQCGSFQVTLDYGRSFSPTSAPNIQRIIQFFGLMNFYIKP